MNEPLPEIEKLWWANWPFRIMKRAWKGHVDLENMKPEVEATGVYFPRHSDLVHWIYRADFVPVGFVAIQGDRLAGVYVTKGLQGIGLSVVATGIVLEDYFRLNSVIVPTPVVGSDGAKGLANIFFGPKRMYLAKARWELIPGGVRSEVLRRFSMGPKETANAPRNRRGPRRTGKLGALVENALGQVAIKG